MGGDFLAKSQLDNFTGRGIKDQDWSTIQFNFFWNKAWYFVLKKVKAQTVSSFSREEAETLAIPEKTF